MNDVPSTPPVGDPADRPGGEDTVTGPVDGDPAPRADPPPLPRRTRANPDALAGAEHETDPIPVDDETLHRLLGHLRRI